MNIRSLKRHFLHCGGTWRNYVFSTSANKILLLCKGLDKSFFNRLCIQKSETTLKIIEEGAAPSPLAAPLSITYICYETQGQYIQTTMRCPHQLRETQSFMYWRTSFLCWRFISLGVWARSSFPLTLHTQARKKLMKQILGTRPVYRHVSNVPTINTHFSSQTP